jgi:ABC-type transport system involved in multi-copper enzyme maturation permease subunit
MILATLRTILGRRGSFIGSLGTALGAVILTIVIVYIVHQRNPTEYASAGGAPLLDAVTAVLVLVGVVVAIVLGALAGSYDVSQGTMRYLLLAGPSRWSIYLSRTVAVLIASWLVLLPALVVGLAACVVLPTAAQDEMTAASVGSSVWNVLLLAGTYALISMGIGSLLRANGAAIAIALVINIGVTPAIGLLSAWSETLGDLALPHVLSELGGTDTGLPIAAAVVAFVVWLALFLGAGWWRVSRDEY